MSWGTIRQSTGEDIARLNVAATSFCKRHDLPPMDWYRLGSELTYNGYGNADYDMAIGNHTCGDLKRLNRLWKRVMRRALREPNADGIAYGYVGYNA